MPRKTKLSRLAASLMNERNMGGDPEVGTDFTNQIDLTKMLSAYGARVNRKKFIQWFEFYMKERDESFLDSHNYLWVSQTVCFIARLKTLNCILSKETEAWFEKQLKAIPRATFEPELVKVSDPVDMRVIASIEEKLDNKDYDFSYLNKLFLPKWAVTKIINFYRPKMEELNLIGVDDQVTEAFENYSDDEIEDIRAGYKAIMDVFGAKVEARKAGVGRQPKEKSAIELTRWMVLSKKDELTGIRGLNAEEIVGKNVLVFYIPEHRTLQIFRAEAGKSFTVKGKSVMNFDPEKSFSKGIRKPEVSLAEFKTKNEVKMMKAFDALTTKARNQRTSLISAKHVLINVF